MAVAASLIACGANDATPSASTSDEIVGGVSAKSSRLDAVGSLGRLKGDGTFTYFCSATLVAPRLVLTAQHSAARSGLPAYTESETIHFAIGEDSKAPRRTVKVARTWMAGLDEGGYIGRGSDVAIMQLDEAIDDVTPLAIANDHVDASVVGSRVSAVGYGIRDVARTSGQRRAGTLTVRATNGPLVQSAFASFEELLSFVRTEGGDAFEPERDESRVRELWDKSILENHELFAGVAPGDAQPCSGDSGGPLIARVEGGLAVFAVVSGSFKLSNSTFNPCSVVGEVYATFPADVQAMFDEAVAAVDGAGPKRVPAKDVVRGADVALPAPADGGDRCAGLPIEGRCEDGVVLRCIAASEGPPRVTRTDCTLVMQTCGVVEATDGALPQAACQDP
jgi:secreted trypsin-like serine protease